MKLLDKFTARQLRQDLNSSDQVFLGSDALGRLALRTAAKKFWKSRVVWLNGLAILFTGLVELSPQIKDYLGDPSGTALVLLIAVVNVVLRAFTVSPLTYSRSQYDPLDSDDPPPPRRGYPSVSSRNIRRMEVHEEQLRSQQGSGSSKDRNRYD